MAGKTRFGVWSLLSYDWLIAVPSFEHATLGGGDKRREPPLATN